MNIRSIKFVLAVVCISLLGTGCGASLPLYYGSVGVISAMGLKTVKDGHDTKKNTRKCKEDHKDDNEARKACYADVMFTGSSSEEF